MPDNPKVFVGDAGVKGCGLFAHELIRGERISRFDGEIYDAEQCSKLPSSALDYAVQCAPTLWRDSTRMARFSNHSCDPNYGIKNLFEIVAMRDINPGEEITWDYDMTENSDWTMECRCGAEHCRGIVRGYLFLPQEFRDRYQGFISDWLIEHHEKIPVLAD